MPRSLRYYVDDVADNVIQNNEWTQIVRLQHWYNSEFIWSCDRLGLKRYIVFANYEKFPDMPYHTAKYHFRKRYLQKKIELQDDVAAIRAMEEEGLYAVRWGGVRDDALASGITHVSDNEFNAYLVCEFLLKCSTIAGGATFTVEDEGRFVLSKRVMFRNGEILVHRSDLYGDDRDIPLEVPQIFSVVNASKYDEHPRYRERVEDFNELDDEKMIETLEETNMLGFGQNYETAWGDAEGLNLQQRARKIEIL